MTPAAARRVNVFVPTLAPNDAVSTQARHHVDLLRRWGHDAVLVADGWHPACARMVMPTARALRRRPDAAWVVHYSIWSAGIPQIVARGARPRQLVYHNVTPVELLPPGPVAEACARARRALPELAGLWDVVTADSGYNADELRRAGFSDVTVVPLILPPARARAVTVPRGDSVLYVGRIAPSKGIDVLVKAVGLLRALHRPQATLDIVGSPEGWEAYAAGLSRMAARIAPGAVTMHGRIGDAARDALYARAGVFCLMSLHEGFCAPLVEAMGADLPVVAVDAGAVGDTLRGGGLLLPRHDPRLAAEAIAEVLADGSLRDALREGARESLARFAPEEVERLTEETLGALVSRPAASDRRPPSR